MYIRGCSVFLDGHWRCLRCLKGDVGSFDNVIPTIRHGTVKCRMAEKNHFRDVFARIIMHATLDSVSTADGERQGKSGPVRPKI